MATVKPGIEQSDEDLAALRDGAGRERAEDEIDAEIALAALANIERDPGQIVSGEELTEALEEIVG